MNYLPGFEPDFEVKQELRFIGGMPDLHQFERVFISCSGGKDSHAMAFLLAELADRQNYNKEKMELLYADTGLEWHDTFDQVKRIGAAIGVAAVKVLPKYKLLDNVRRRWAKFNGLEWEDSRAEQSRAEQSRAEQSRAEQDERMAVKQARFRILHNDSAPATTNGIRSISMSVSEQQNYVVQKSRETVSHRIVCQNSGGGYVESTIPKYPCKILHRLGKARTSISTHPGIRFRCRIGNIARGKAKSMLF